ncbi:PREDICTED: DNA-directed RNA polymerase, mitochondrial [Chinchilla lanigera]|uniref:DNA-directed RNA polymerase n=1 Tax=Chinchilla lanigera TaxID=34839 RepID=A0A8C2VCS2_CHILA|nr:PREDICTED: DNA-directed RNA polymerase, mitochondrial [Chinchilla lanigera]
MRGAGAQAGSMAALRWGRGAAELSRALRSSGRPCAMAKEGILGGLWGPRMNSSASPCEQERQKDWGRVELLEVLEARVRQLQAESVSEVTVKRVEVARVPADSGRAGGTPPPVKSQLKISRGWAKRLDQDQQVLQKRQKLLQEKLQVHGQFPIPKFKPKVKAKSKGKAKPMATDKPPTKTVATATAKSAATATATSMTMASPMATAKPTTRSTAAPKANPKPTAAPKANPKPTSTSTAAPKANPKPTATSTAASKANPKPTATSTAAPKANPKPTSPAAPKANPKPTATSMAASKANPKPTATSTAAPKPNPEATSVAASKAQAKPSATSTATPKAKHVAMAKPPLAEPQLVSKQQASKKHRRKGPAPELVQGTWEEWVPSQPWAASLKPSSSSAQALPKLTLEQQAQQQRLQVFLECCLASGQVALAHHMLVSHLAELHKQYLLTQAMYNTVMLGWARQGSYQELVSVLTMMKYSGFTPDLLSYASILQCMGRVDQDVTTIQRCLEQMAQDGLQLEQLFLEETLSSEERAALLRAVLKAKPDFCPPQPSPQVNTSALLREIYAKDGPVSYPKLHLPLETLQAMFQEQLKVELAGKVQVESVEKVLSPTQETLAARKTLETLRRTWEAELHNQLQATKANLAQVTCQGRLTLYPFLCVLPEDQLVEMLIQLLFALPAQGEPFVHVVHRLAMQTFQRHIVQQRQRRGQLQALEQRYTQYLQLLACDTQVADPCLPRQYWETLGLPEPPPPQLWPMMELLPLGKLLLEILVQSVQLPPSLAPPQSSSHPVPVLYHVYTFRGIRQIGLLRPHPAFIQLLEDAAEPMLIFEAADMPMLCPPLPWTSSQAGGFLLSPTKLMRSVEGTLQHQHLLESCTPAALHGALDTVTQLGNCAWRVNGRVLDLVLEVFHNKGCARLGVPPPTSEAPRPPLDHLLRNAPPDRKAQLRQEVARCLKVAREMHGLRQEALYRLSLAQHLRHRVFWLPHNMDFRGRTYPCPPHFNHLGSDLARALLEFAQGRPLGPHGLSWLKIHLVNLTGLKKREPLHARLAFANTMMDDILDSADRPMTGRKWWMEAEDPWQTLACCMEVARAVRSPDPTAYVSHLPVHQDGSCNGLQHYAALGRDSVGAASVNLMPADEPQDVYSGVAAQVEVFRTQDAQQGLKVAQVLEGFISRKVVKQTVMTVVYGVTIYGGRLQIEKRLREIRDFPQVFVWEASQYLVHLVFKSLQEMFAGTRTIQHWLTQSARLIAQAGSAVEWVTPLGVPIVQPYHQESKLVIRGGLQSITWNSSVDASQKPNLLRQKNGFPPNFIHSLDSCHMMLTALHCYRKGLTFVSVHDCFWTHACDIPVMNEVCREQFVRLHSQPILEDLSAFLVRRFCSADSPHPGTDAAQTAKLLETLRSVPRKGDFDLEQVKGSTYFFS